MGELFLGINRDAVLAGYALAARHKPSFTDAFLPLTKIVLEEYRDHKVQLRYCRRESLQPRPLDTCHCVSLRKSVSSGCLNSADWMNRSCSVRPKLLDFQGLDFEAAFGLRMAYSEGDIQV